MKRKGNPRFKTIKKTITRGGRRFKTTLHVTKKGKSKSKK
jgi:DNA-binding phage protein